MGAGKIINVAEFEFSKTKGIKFINSLPSTQARKEIWSISSQQYQKVDMVMYSPNYWNKQTIGNKHFFFMLENCRNPEKSRGFFNEYLHEDLREHRKVFEVLGNKMRTPESDTQLSGLGFSSTQRNSVLCKVKGSFSRTVKIVF